MNHNHFEHHFEQAISKRYMLACVEMVVKEPSLLPLLISLSLSDNKKLAGRATWTLESVQLTYHEFFRQQIPLFLTYYTQQTGATCRRHFTNILSRLIEKKEIIGVHDTDPLVETTLMWMDDPQTPVAVLVNCWTILFLLSSKYDWLPDELSMQIQFKLKEATAAMHARGKKILTLLHKRKIW